MKIFLDDYLAAAGEDRISTADSGSILCGAVTRIFGAVHKSHHIAIIEIAEVVHLVGDCDGVADAFQDLRGEFKAGVGALGANLKQDVTRGRNGVESGSEFPGMDETRRDGERRRAGPMRPSRIRRRNGARIRRL